MINRPKITPKRQLESRNDLRKPTSKPSKKTAKIFGRAASFEAPRLASPLSLIQTKPPSSKSLQYVPVAYSARSTRDQPPVSPTHTIASILNDMEAYPSSSMDSHLPWERDQPSLRIDTGVAVISGYSRDSVELNPPQPNEVGQSIYSSLRPRISPESSMAAVSRGGQSVLSVASGGSGGSRASDNSSSGSQQSGSTLRVVGRGGSGSRLRQFGPHLQKPDPTLIVKQDQRPPLIRPSGRGGLGSRPKPLAAPLAKPNNSTPISKSSAAETPVLIRPSGRGGLASRPKPPGAVASPSLLKILGKRKARVDKGKGKAPEERRAIHPLPPNHTYSVSNASSSSLSTIHFVGETGEPSTPFFPDDRSLDSIHSDAGKSNTSSSSMFSSDQSSSRTTIHSENPDENDEQFNESRPTTPVDHRQRNINKLTRTLGELPDNALFRDPVTQRPSETSSSKNDKNSNIFRRSSMSVTNLGSIFNRSGARARDSVATSSMTDDLHQFGLADDLSDSWGKMSESSSFICPPPASPILFSPPSPTAAPKPKESDHPSGVSDDDSEAEQSTEFDTLFYASSTLSRSNSYSASPSQRPSIASHSRSTSTSILSESRLGSNRSIWLIPVKDDDDDLEVGHIRRLDIPEKPQNWSGEWNNDLQQVIKSLRLL